MQNHRRGTQNQISDKHVRPYSLWTANIVSRGPHPTLISEAIKNSNATNGKINAACESSVSRGDFNYRSPTDENNYAQNENETYTVPDPELTNTGTPNTLPWPNIVPLNSIPEQGIYNLK